MCIRDSSIGDGFDLIRHGRAKAMIVGGTEASVTQFCINSFANMKALSTRNETPKTASRPFSKDRDGFVMGEGAGILILEELESALARGAKDVYKRQLQDILLESLQLLVEQIIFQ